MNVLDNLELFNAIGGSDVMSRAGLHSMTNGHAHINFMISCNEYQSCNIISTGGDCILIMFYKLINSAWQIVREITTTRRNAADDFLIELGLRSHA